MREKLLGREREKTRENLRHSAAGVAKEVNKGIEHADASGWNEFRRRRTEQSRIRTDVARNYQYYEKEKRRISYFFTNFPENFMAKHLLKAFLNYGDFEEVVVPAKRDRRGKRFGFARALGVDDPENFAVKLDNIIIGHEKIMVNLPKFDRQGKEQLAAEKPSGAGRNVNVNRQQQKSSMKYKTSLVHQYHSRPKMTYAEIVNPKPQPDNPNNPVLQNLEQNQKKANAVTIQNQIQNQKPAHNKTITEPKPKSKLNYKQLNQKRKHGFVPPPRLRKPWAHRTFDVDEEQFQKLKTAYIGVVNRPGLSYRMHGEFAQEGYFSVKTTLMGANLVLLESKEEGEIEALLEDAKNWLAIWFKDIRKWSPREVDDEPLTWLKVCGVPLHAWTEEFFKFIVSETGEFIILDEDTKKKRTLDVARILIRRKRYDVINFMERFEINGELFSSKLWRTGLHLNGSPTISQQTMINTHHQTQIQKTKRMNFLM